MNVTCNENQNGNWVVVDFQEKIPISPINCLFSTIGWNSITLEVTDYSNNKVISIINVTTTFGDPVKIVTSSANSYTLTTDDLLQLEGRVQNSNGAERPIQPQEWYDGLTPLSDFSIESSADGYVELNPIKTGLHNLTVSLYNSTISFEINVLRGANHHVEFRAIPPINGNTDDLGNSIFTPDEAIHFQMKWYDEDNNPGDWENYIGNDVGYVEILEDFTEHYVNASDAESDDSLIGHWINNEFYPLRRGQVNLWLGQENANGELSRGTLSVTVEPGIPRELYLSNIENNSIELIAGMPWIAELYGYDLGYNTVEIESYDWDLVDSSVDLEIAKAGLIKTNQNNDGHFTLSQSIAGIHVIETSYTNEEGIPISLSLQMNISPTDPEVLIVNPTIIEVYAGENFEINATLFDRYGNQLGSNLIQITYSSGVCNCISDNGNWKINNTGVEYIYLQSGDINSTIEVRVFSNSATNVEVKLGAPILWGYESLEIGETKSLNITAKDGYENIVDLEYTSITFDEIGDGLSLDYLDVTAMERGNSTISGKIINDDGSEVNFAITIHVWGNTVSGDDGEKQESSAQIKLNQKLTFSEFLTQNYIQLIWVFTLVYLFIILGLMRNSRVKRKKEESKYDFDDW